MSSFEEMVKSIKPVTRVLVFAGIGMAVAVGIRLISPYSLILDMDRTVRNFEIWRPFTSLMFMGPFGIPLVFTLVLLGTQSQRLESTFLPESSTADYVFLLLFSSIPMILVGWLFGMFILSHSLTFLVVYLVSKHFPDEQINVWGIPLMRKYFPWLMLALDFLLGQSPVEGFSGIVCGHLYWYLTVIYPRDNHIPPLIRTPSFLKRLLNPHGVNLQPRVGGGTGRRLGAG